MFHPKSLSYQPESYKRVLVFWHDFRFLLPEQYETRVS